MIATTFSPEATAHIISSWQQQPGAARIRTINRTSAALERLLDTPALEDVDLVVTSSPMLLQHLQEHDRLAELSGLPDVSRRLVPLRLRDNAAAVAFSGYGILVNKRRMAENNLPVPVSWDSLTDSRYRGLLLMSSPSRSDTYHLMVESLLQQRGWDKGWALLLNISGNLATISSRSFGVADKIKAGLGGAGPVIDNYARLLLGDPELAFNYLPDSATSPTFVAISRYSLNKENARAFIGFLLSEQGQKVLADSSTGKYPVTPLPRENPREPVQRRLLNSPYQMDENLVLKRQRMVQQLFDTAITFRLTESIDAWRALYTAEARVKRPLPHIRALLTAMPVSAQESADPAYYSRFDDNRKAEEEYIRWQQFFREQQRKAIAELEKVR
nr:phosphoglycerate transport regulator PgtC [Morganella morganii subsp. sibonii]